MSQYAQSSSVLSNELVADLRSDTVTVPCDGMRAAMASAEVGDDVYGEDPSVLRLEGSLAERLGKEAGLFVPSGTQSNLLAMLSHCARGEEVIAGEAYHVIRYEAAGASVLGGISLRPLAVADDGGLDPDAIKGAIQPDDSHHPISRLLSLENTHYGKAISLARITAAVETARQNGLSVHLDGARYFNAVAALGCDEGALAAQFDTVSVCLSKGLGTPIGSVLLGPDEVIKRARRWRKMLGGGMRQAGVLAAAGLFALDHNVTRLSEDHTKAETLAAHLSKLNLGTVTQATNMVFLTPQSGFEPDISLARFGIKCTPAEPTTRFVLHKDIGDQEFSAVLQAFESAAEARGAA